MKRENFSKKKKRYFGDLLCLGRGDKDIIKKKLGFIMIKLEMIEETLFKIWNMKKKKKRRKRFRVPTVHQKYLANQ